MLSSAMVLSGGLLFVAFQCNVSWSQDCDAVLKDGVFNSFQELRSGDLKNAFQNAYCNKQGNSSGSSSGTSVGASYAGFGLDFGHNSNDTSQSRNENCGNGSGSMSDDQFVRAMQSVVDQHIVDVWLACKQAGYGITIEGRLNGDFFRLKYIFRAAGSVAQATVEDPHIEGATCDDSVKKGTVINTGGRIQNCKRTGDGPVSVTVNSNFQSAEFYIPAVRKEDANEDFCKNWRGPGVPVQCLSPQQRADALELQKRTLPGVGVAPPGYTWCVLDTRFNSPPNVQGYCFSKEASGQCHCAIVPAGYPQPSTSSYGTVYEPHSPFGPQ